MRASIRYRFGLFVGVGDCDARVDGLVAMLIDTRSRSHKPLTKERLFGWHAALFSSGYSGLHKIHVGGYRGVEEMQIVSGPIGHETVHYVAPPIEGLRKEMDRFLHWVNNDNGPDPMLKAGIAHL